MMKPIIALFVLCFVCQAHATGIELEISSESLTINKDARPNVSATVINSSNKDVTLVKPGDGSRSKWRTPVVGWSVIPAEYPKATHSQDPPLYKGGRCGNINALKPDEVFVLKPGESKALEGWFGALSFPKPGKYRVVLYYFNLPYLQWSGLPIGKHDEKAIREVKNSTKCELVSNELIFTVIE